MLPEPVTDTDKVRSLIERIINRTIRKNEKNEPKLNVVILPISPRNVLGK